MPIDTSTSGGRAAKFEDVGDLIDGVVISADDRQQTNAETREPEFWPDGKPKMQWVIVLATTERVDAEDDGARTVYAKGGKGVNFAPVTGEGLSAMEAIRAAVKKSGAKIIEEGGRLQVAHTGLGKRDGVKQAPKLYKAKYTPPAAGLDPFAD